MPDVIISSGKRRPPNPRRGHFIVVTGTRAEFALWCVDNKKDVNDYRVVGLCTTDPASYIRALAIEVREGDQLVFSGGDYEVGAHYKQVISALKHQDPHHYLEELWK